MDKLQPILEKLKGLLDHLEKIILGLVLVVVAAISVKMLLGAKGELTDVSKAMENTTLGGGSHQTNDISTFSELVRISTKNPPNIDLEGDNHKVFNSAKWNKIVTNGVTNLVRDSVTRPLGISALQVTRIKPILLTITPKIQYNRAPTQLGDNNMRYTFEADDEYPSRHMSVGEFMAFKRNVRHSFYSQRHIDTMRMRSFLPQIRPFQRQKSVSRSTQPSTNSDVKPLHLFGNIRRPLSWEVRYRFTKASRARLIENVVVTFDVIYGLPSGGLVTNLNQTAKANQPVPFTRGHMADLYFKTEFTPEPIVWEGVREGLRLSIDQEVFRVIKITPDLVQLVSDRGYGGNGQIFDKPWAKGGVDPANPPRPGVPVIPVPGATTNVMPTAQPPVVNPPATGGQ